MDEVLFPELCTRRQICLNLSGSQMQESLVALISNTSQNILTNTPFWASLVISRSPRVTLSANTSTTSCAWKITVLFGPPPIYPFCEVSPSGLPVAARTCFTHLREQPKSAVAVETPLNIPENRAPDFRVIIVFFPLNCPLN